MNNKKTKLLFETMAKNPTLPVVIKVSEQGLMNVDDWRYDFIDDIKISIEEIWQWKNKFLSDELEIREYAEDLAYEELGETGTKKYHNLVEAYIKENVIKFDAIVVRI